MSDLKQEAISESSLALYCLFIFAGRAHESAVNQLPQIGAQRRPVIFTTGAKTKIVCQKSHPCGSSAIHDQCSLFCNGRMFEGMEFSLLYIELIMNYFLPRFAIGLSLCISLVLFWKLTLILFYCLTYTINSWRK